MRLEMWVCGYTPQAKDFKVEMNEKPHVTLHCTPDITCQIWTDVLTWAGDAV